MFKNVFSSISSLQNIFLQSSVIKTWNNDTGEINFW